MDIKILYLRTHIDLNRQVESKVGIEEPAIDICPSNPFPSRFTPGSAPAPYIPILYWISVIIFLLHPHMMKDEERHPISTWPSYLPPKRSAPPSIPAQQVPIRRTQHTRHSTSMLHSSPLPFPIDTPLLRFATRNNNTPARCQVHNDLLPPIQEELNHGADHNVAVTIQTMPCREGVAAELRKALETRIPVMP